MSSIVWVAGTSVVLLSMSCCSTVGMAFTPCHISGERNRVTRVSPNLFSVPQQEEENDDATNLSSVLNRRAFWNQAGILAAAGSVVLSPATGWADEQVVAAAPPVEMKDFVDPVGYFSIRVPKNFFTLRRSAKGDLPDAKTGQGRRGSSIFSAGDMAKAEVVAIERYETLVIIFAYVLLFAISILKCSPCFHFYYLIFASSFPTRVLLEENGIEATGDLSTFPALGKPKSVATLLNLRRERDKPSQSKTILIEDSVSVSPDGKVLSFKLKNEIDVQKPELLMEQYGVSELFRVTLAKATLQSNDGNLMAVFASALEQDFNGPDGVALQETVDSFTVTDQSSAAAS